MAASIAVTLFFLLFGLPAGATEIMWRLDSFSFLHFPGVGYTAPLLGDVSIPLEISEKRRGVWALRIRASKMPTRALPQIGSLEITAVMKHDAGGQCALVDAAFQCKLFTLFSVKTPRDVEPVAIPVGFSSAPVGRSSALVVAQREGFFDPSSRTLQLVGVGESPLGSGFAPGQPFYVVLSGRLDTVPAAMLLQQTEASGD